MRQMLFALAIFLMPLTVVAGEKDTSDQVNLAERELLHQGEMMYREGILPSGKKMKAAVPEGAAGDGFLFTCVNCHLRSGMGAVEGSIFTLPVNGGNLFRPLLAGHFNMGLPSLFQGMPQGTKMSIPWFKPIVNARPAYTEKTLADALRRGIDPTGRTFSAVMPRYELDDRDMQILTAYLRSLSATFSPGVTATTLRFATIVTEGVSREDREAMLIPLKAFLQIKNSRADVMKGRKRVAEMMDESYRRLILDVWELKGEPETWTAQLEDYYRKGPAFAIIGGIAAGEWTPIHRFCEQQKIPCILPITDFPALSEKDWYTLYFSKGLYQEAETVAEYLDELPGFPKDWPIVQVFRSGRHGGVLSKAFQETWKKAGGAPTKNALLAEGKAIDADFWRQLTAEHNNAVFLLWLQSDDLGGMSFLTAAKNKPRSVFVSATLLKDSLYTLPESVREITYITYPHRLPEENQQQKQQMGQMNGPIPVETWLKSRSLKSANLALSSKSFFLSLLLTPTLLHMQGNFYRDYFLDQFDMMEDQTASTDYPRLSFGPGQRYAARGCYIVQLSKDLKPFLIKRNAWSSH